MFIHSCSYSLKHLFWRKTWMKQERKWRKKISKLLPRKSNPRNPSQPPWKAKKKKSTSSISLSPPNAALYPWPGVFFHQVIHYLKLTLLRSFETFSLVRHTNVGDCSPTASEAICSFTQTLTRFPFGRLVNLRLHFLDTHIPIAQKPFICNGNAAKKISNFERCPSELCRQNWTRQAPFDRT